MKAFKGCINSGCTVYKKKHYKKDDKFCLQCGEPLSFVCADCWKPMDVDDNRYCISCAAKREQKRAQNIEDAMKMGNGVMGIVGAAAGTVASLGANADKIAGGARKIADAGVRVARIVKK